MYGLEKVNFSRGYLMSRYVPTIHPIKPDEPGTLPWFAKSQKKTLFGKALSSFGILKKGVTDE